MINWRCLLCGKSIDLHGRCDDCEAGVSAILKGMAKPEPEPVTDSPKPLTDGPCYLCCAPRTPQKQLGGARVCSGCERAAAS